MACDPTRVQEPSSLLSSPVQTPGNTEACSRDGPQPHLGDPSLGQLSGLRMGRIPVLGDGVAGPREDGCHSDVSCLPCPDLI